jgi:hypothetical protein
MPCEEAKPDRLKSVYDNSFMILRYRQATGLFSSAELVGIIDLVRQTPSQFQYIPDK